MSSKESIISLRVMRLLEKTVYASIMSRCRNGLEEVNLISSQIPTYFLMNFMTSMLITKSSNRQSQSVTCGLLNLLTLREEEEST